MTSRVLVAVLGFVIVAAAPADGRGPARNGLIAVAALDQLGSSQVRLLTPGFKPRRVLAVQPLVDLPRFSPDGHWLAFWAGPDPDRSVPWIAEAGGANARPLLPVPSGREPALEYWGPPVWAPDSRSLAYVDEHAKASSTTLLSTIHIVAVDGRSDRALPLTGWRGSRPPSSFALLSWRGRRMLVRSKASGRQYVLDLRQRRLTLLPGIDSLSPSGKSVACADAGRLSILDLDTQQRRQLRTASSVESAPAWSRDGSSLAVTTSHGIELIPLRDRSRPAQLFGTSARNLVWSPDGRYLLTDRPAVISVSSRTGVPLKNISTSGDYGSPVDWQPR